jgi:hypothetical protein
VDDCIAQANGKPLPLACFISEDQKEKNEERNENDYMKYEAPIYVERLKSQQTERECDVFLFCVNERA